MTKEKQKPVSTPGSKQPSPGSNRGKTFDFPSERIDERAATELPQAILKPTTPAQPSSNSGGSGESKKKE